MNKFFKTMTCAALAALTLANATMSASAANYDSCYKSFTYNGTLCDGSGVQTSGATQNYKYFTMTTSSSARYGGADVAVPYITVSWQKKFTATGALFGSLDKIEESNASSASWSDGTIPLAYSISNRAYHEIGLNSSTLYLDDYTDTNI